MEPCPITEYSGGNPCTRAAVHKQETSALGYSEHGKCDYEGGDAEDDSNYTIKQTGDDPRQQPSNYSDNDRVAFLYYEDPRD